VTIKNQFCQNPVAAIYSSAIDDCPFVPSEKKHFFFKARKNRMVISHTLRLDAEAFRKF
jgi:hypothetical protein